MVPNESSSLRLRRVCGLVRVHGIEYGYCEWFVGTKGVYVNIILRDGNWCFTTLLCFGDGCYLYPTDTATHSNVVARAYDVSMMYIEVVARFKRDRRTRVVEVVPIY